MSAGAAWGHLFSSVVLPNFLVKLEEQERVRFQEFVRGKWTPGEVILIAPHDYSERRSLLQNAYLHAEPIKKLCAWTGYTPAQQKIVMLGEYFGWAKLNGYVVPEKPSTSELTTREFADWCDFLIQFGAENGINILPPEKDPMKRDPRVFTP